MERSVKSFLPPHHEAASPPRPTGFRVRFLVLGEFESDVLLSICHSPKSLNLLFGWTTLPALSKLTILFQMIADKALKIRAGSWRHNKKSSTLTEVPQSSIFNIEDPEWWLVIHSLNEWLFHMSLSNCLQDFLYGCLVCMTRISKKSLSKPDSWFKK